MKQPYQYQITLEAARVNAGISLKDAAKALRMSVDRLEQYEKDSSIVQALTARRIILLYCAPIDLIYWGKASECQQLNRQTMKECLMKSIVEEVSQPG
jgi:transcriptional regulator with XRE-family HTH domain